MRKGGALGAFQREDEAADEVGEKAAGAALSVIESGWQPSGKACNQAKQVKSPRLAR